MRPPLEAAGRDRAVVWGGSHGGFIGAHLAGQQPGRFKGVMLRNPVINIASMTHTTDIAVRKGPGT